MYIQTYGRWKPAAFYPIITRGFPNYSFVAFVKLFYACMGISVFSCNTFTLPSHQAFCKVAGIYEMITLKNT